MLQKLFDKLLKKQENEEQVNSIKEEVRDIVTDTTQKMEQVNSILEGSVTVDLARAMGLIK